MRTTLSPSEIEDLERKLGGRGLTAAEVLALFRERGMRMSEGTFRKYVQAGLLPRSRRVGSKGKHRGSRGIYPAGIVRRLNTVKAMMAEGMTLEEIRGSFLFLRGELDTVELGVAEVADRLADALDEAPLDDRQRARMQAELDRLRAAAARLTEGFEKVAGRIVAARELAALEREGR